MSSSTAVTLFVSYAHDDDDLREELVKHLKLLQRQGVIEDWYDRLIQAGEEWNEEIQTRLLTSNVILLLVSADFLASDYCWDQEVFQAMERHRNADAVVIPVILRACDWNSAPFGKIQALPRDARPVTSWKDRDAAFLDIARGIRQVALGIQTKLAEAEKKGEQINSLRSRLPELMDRDHFHQARDILRELERLGWNDPEFEDWRQRIEESILREERAGDLLDSAIRASEGEHYEEALKYLDEAASLSPDHSGIERIRTAVENRQQNRVGRAPDSPPVSSGRPIEKQVEPELPRRRDSTERAEKESAVLKNQNSVSADSAESSADARLAEHRRAAESTPEEKPRSVTTARGMIGAFRDRSRLQLTGGLAILFLVAFLFYRSGPATGDQSAIGQSSAEVAGNQSSAVQMVSPSGAAVDDSESLEEVRQPLKDQSQSGPAVSAQENEGTVPAGLTEQVSETAAQPSGGPDSQSTDSIAEGESSLPDGTSRSDQASPSFPPRERIADQPPTPVDDSQARIDPLASEWLSKGFGSSEGELREQIARLLRQILVKEPKNRRANLYLGMIYLEEGRIDDARNRLLSALLSQLAPEEERVARSHLWRLPHHYSVEHFHPTLGRSDSGCSGTLSFESDVLSFKSSGAENDKIAVPIPTVRRAEFEEGTLSIQVQGGQPLTFRFAQPQHVREVHALLVYGYGFSGSGG